MTVLKKAGLPNELFDDREPDLIKRREMRDQRHLVDRQLEKMNNLSASILGLEC
jgi:hypothetical protein